MMKSLFKKEYLFYVFLGLIGVSLVVSSAYATTTISTSINTGGTLVVTGQIYASSTVATGGNITVPPAYGLDTASAGALNIGTTTANAVNIGQAGVLTTVLGTLTVTQGTTLSSTLSVSGATTLLTASSTGLVKANSLNVGGSGTDVNNIVYGFCNITSGSVNAILASTTAFVSCSGATGVVPTSKVFVQATSSLTSNLIIQSASSSPVAGTISLEIFNLGNAGTLTPPLTSIDFFGIR
jgi:hypothetical protein